VCGYIERRVDCVVVGEHCSCMYSEWHPGCALVGGFIAHASTKSGILNVRLSAVCVCKVLQ
jgi:primosomal replication protein N